MKKGWEGGREGERESEEESEKIRLLPYNYIFMAV